MVRLNDMFDGCMIVDRGIFVLLQLSYMPLEEICMMNTELLLILEKDMRICDA
jgi:hypothetical protein